MIVRILGEGQWRLEDSALTDLNALDDQIEKAVTAADQDQLAAALGALHEKVRVLGAPVPDDALEDSDLILPGADASVTEVEALLGESSEGLIPG